MAQRFVITSGRKAGKRETLRQLTAGEDFTEMSIPEMVDCPGCYGSGVYDEEGHLVRCDICHGTGTVTQAAFNSYISLDAEINEARRRYESQFTED